MKGNRDCSYNEEPVYYCKHCLSLKIVGCRGMEFCDDCGSVSIDQCHIDEWERLYKSRTGHNYLDEF